MTRRWTPEQEAALAPFGGETVLSAAAGAGKTAVLVEKVLRGALDESLDLSRLLAVTFTNKAAAELHERLHQALEDELLRRLREGAAARGLRRQLAELGQAQISTFHSFCGEVLRRYGRLEGQGGGRVLAEEEAQLLRHELCGALLDEALGADWELGPLKARELALGYGGEDGIGPDDLSQARMARGLRPQVLRLLAFAQSLPDPEAWIAEKLPPPLDPEAYDSTHPLLRMLEDSWRGWAARAAADSREYAAELAESCPAAAYPELLRLRAAALGSLSLAAGWEAAREGLAQFWQKPAGWASMLKGSSKKGLDDEARAREAEAQAKRFEKGLLEWRETFAADYALFARRENAALAACRGLWELTRRFAARLDDNKLSRNVLDFSDMERRAYALLSAGAGPDGRPVPSAAALELRARYQLVLVDEYQDTSPLQDAILELVTPEGPQGRPRLIVGDLKQSIYGFRLADPDIFKGHIERWSSRELFGPGPRGGGFSRRTNAESATEVAATGEKRAAGGPVPIGRALKLTANFRSRPAIVSAVNQVFRGLLSPDFGGEDYAQNELRKERAAEYDELFAGARAEGLAGPPPPEPDRPARLHIVVAGKDAPPAAGESEEPEEGGEEDNAEGSAEGSADGLDRAAIVAVARRTAALLLEIKAEGQRIYDPASRTVRPVRWGDVAVLLRSLAGRVEPLRAELERAGVPTSATGRSGFYERPEVSAALSLLCCIDNPLDDIALAAALSGPAGGLSYAELLAAARPELFAGTARLRLASEEAPLWQRVNAFAKADASNPVSHRLQRFTERLAHWRNVARAESLDALLARVLADSGLWAASAAMPSGPQRLANLEALLAQARAFSAFEQPGLARFLRYLRQSRRSAGDQGEAPLLGEGEDAVRVLSVHQSKGLEFPVVLLADVQKRFNELDLRSDFVFTRRAGIGARYISLRDDPPQRRETLLWRSVRASLRESLRQEELRLLYVALTRARERLEVVAAAGGEALAKLLPARTPTVEAAGWLDWLAPQLRAPFNTAREQFQASGTGSAEAQSWQVLIGSDCQPPPAGPASESAAGAGLDLAALEARLAWRYGLERLAALPAKASVSAIAKAATQPGEDGLAELAPEELDPAQAGAAGPLRVARPSRFAPPAVSPADYGTAVHALLAAVPFGPPEGPLALPDAAALSLGRAGLLAQGRLSPEQAAQIVPAALAAALAPLAPQLTHPQARIYRELPFGLLVPAADYARLRGEAWAAELAAQLAAAGGAGAGDSVYVQGVIDLLVLSPAGALVVDYKTDRGASAQGLLARYRGQLEWYARAALSLLPGLAPQAVRWAILGLGGAGLLGPHSL